ncbi:MAG TPA: hypothetical protein VKV03_02690 [Candidatus Binataceae bacterium]|nr:hypothetical protein [Candidatus Binataceae bacterium]
MDARNKKRIRSAGGGLAIETVLLLATLALLLAAAVKHMSGTDGAVVAAVRSPASVSASR